MSIKEFKVENVTDYEALNVLRGKEEVKKMITKLGLDNAISSIHTSSAYIPKDERKNIPKFSIDRHGATFRQILNEIVKASGRMTWIYTERDCGFAKQFSVYFVQ